MQLDSSYHHSKDSFKYNKEIREDTNCLLLTMKDSVIKNAINCLSEMLIGYWKTIYDTLT